jgi:hypothetical protein
MTLVTLPLVAYSVELSLPVVLHDFSEFHCISSVILSIYIKWFGRPRLILSKVSSAEVVTFNFINIDLFYRGFNKMPAVRVICSTLCLVLILHETLQPAYCESIMERDLKISYSQGKILDKVCELKYNSF